MIQTLFDCDNFYFNYNWLIWKFKTRIFVTGANKGTAFRTFLASVATGKDLFSQRRK